MTRTLDPLRHRVLAYHSISAPPVELPASIDLSPARFRRHLRALSRGHRVLPVARMLEGGEEGVALTFDDGYRDNYLEAYPALVEYRLPALFFVATSLVGSAWDSPGGPMPGLRPAELAEMAAHPLVEFGSHGHAHRPLDGLEDAALRAELEGSRKRLEDWTGSRVRYLSYPFGVWDERVADTVREAGYEAAFAVWNPRPGPFSLTRVPLARRDGTWRLRLKLSPAYHRLKRWLRP